VLHGEVARVIEELDAAAQLGRPLALGEQHVEDVVRGAVAEELAKGLLVPGNAETLDQLEKVPRLVEGERGLGEVGILREEVGGRAVNVGEVAAAAAGDEDLAARLRVVVQHRHAAAALAGHGGAHQARSARAQHQDIEAAFARRGRHGLIVADASGIRKQVSC